MSPIAKALTEEEIAALSTGLDGWNVVEGKKIHKRFKFDSFAAAMGWMVSVAIVADKIDHHPNWSNVYNRVDVTLWTHSIDALSQFDRQLAGRMDALAR